MESIKDNNQLSGVQSTEETIEKGNERNINDRHSIPSIEGVFSHSGFKPNEDVHSTGQLNNV